MVLFIKANRTKRALTPAVALQNLMLTGLLWVMSPAANALGPSVVISGPGKVVDGAGNQVATFHVDVFFEYPLVTCPTNNPDCNVKTVPVCVDYRAVAETAKADEDFQPTNGQLSKTVVFNGPGDAHLGDIDVNVIGDTKVEGEETFKVVLTAPSGGCQNNANIGVREARATIIDGESQRPDLTVTDIRLSQGCQIEVTLKNAGSGLVPDAAYHKTQGAAIQMHRNGAPWGGLRLVGVDPLKKLQTAGASITHAWFPRTENLKLKQGTHTLQLRVDQNNAVAESNENNNSLSRTLVCTTQ